MLGHGSGNDGAVYFICPECCLTIRPKAAWLTIEHCPRCLARKRKAVRVFTSTLPAGELYARGRVPDPDAIVAPPIMASN